jgi:hypothetical protein
VYLEQKGAAVDDDFHQVYGQGEHLAEKYKEETERGEGHHDAHGSNVLVGAQKKRHQH